MAVPYTFATATTSIPLSQLDSNFATAITLGNTAVYLGNTTTTLGNVTLTNATISSGNVTISSISDSGNLTFTGTGNRITGDFTNATFSNRVAFQTSTVNGATTVFAIPNGTGTTAGFFANNDSALTNGSEAQLFTNGTTDVRISSAIRGTGTYLPMTFYTNGSERMRIDTSGNVGIGTTSIESFGGGHKTLEVAGSTNTEGGVFKTATSGSAGSGSTGTEMLMFTDSVGGKINVVSSHPAIFYTSNTERMRIDSSGNITCAGVYSATVGATNRDVYVDNTGLLGYVSSIRASKTNIALLSDISWLYQLNPVSFNYRKKDEDGKYTDEADGEIQYGMIAEEVEVVRQDLCFYDEVDGEQQLRGISYSKLVPVLLKAIQELKDEVNSLKTKFN